MKQFLVALALIAATFAPARAGGLHATIEGPANDGVTYTVRALDCPPGVTLKPWICADGLADGKLHSLRLDLQPTAEPGVYTFQRGWPERGDWMLRVSLGDPPPGPATVASVSYASVGATSRLTKPSWPAARSYTGRSTSAAA